MGKESSPKYSILLPQVLCWDFAEYAKYCHISYMWRAIIANWILVCGLPHSNFGVYDADIVSWATFIM
jgi:hypothetical protein